MSNIFEFRDGLISDYSRFSTSFANIAAPDIKEFVKKESDEGRFWPEPILQLNANYLRDKDVKELSAPGGLLHPQTAQFFSIKKQGEPSIPFRLFKHQVFAIQQAQAKKSYVVTTGTGSGKSLCFFVPIINRILEARRAGEPRRTRAIVIYPMNALANSQREELEKFIHRELRALPPRKAPPGFDFSWVVPVNKRFGFTVSGAHSNQYTSEDYSQNNDLAARNPGKLKELQALFLKEAAKYEEVRAQVEAEFPPNG